MKTTPRSKARQPEELNSCDSNDDYEQHIPWQRPENAAILPTLLSSRDPNPPRDDDIATPNVVSGPNHNTTEQTQPSSPLTSMTSLTPSDTPASSSPIAQKSQKVSLNKVKKTNSLAHLFPDMNHSIESDTKKCRLSEPRQDIPSGVDIVKEVATRTKLLCIWRRTCELICIAEVAHRAIESAADDKTKQFIQPLHHSKRSQMFEMEALVKSLCLDYGLDVEGDRDYLISAII